MVFETGILERIANIIAGSALLPASRAYATTQYVFLILVLRILYRSQTPKHIDKKARGIRVVFMYFDISFHKPSRIWTILPSHM